MSFGISYRFQQLSQTQRQVTHVLLTRPPLDGKSKSEIVQALNHQWAISFDLHVLGMPPAFILSQDQTLKNILNYFFHLFPSYSNNLDVLLSFQRSFSALLYKTFLRSFLSSAIKIYHIQMPMSTTFLKFFQFFLFFLKFQSKFQFLLVFSYIFSCFSCSFLFNICFILAFITY